MSAEMAVLPRRAGPAAFLRGHGTAHWSVREENEYYVPDFVTGDPQRSRPDVYRAANEHAADLRDAGQALDDALNLARVLRRSGQDEADARAMEADTVLRIVAEKLENASRLIDRHDARYLNLFMAYFDLKDGQDG